MCRQCEKNPVYEFTNQRKLCKTCYVSWFEKKFLYTLRKFNMLDKGDTVSYTKSNDVQTKVLEHLLKMIEGRRIKIKNKGKKIALNYSTDFVAEKIIDLILNGNIKDKEKFKPVYKNKIMPLYLFLDKEIELYAKIKNIEFKKRKKENSLLNYLEKKHPEVKQSVVKGILEI